MIKDLSELAKLLKLCRKQGVKEIKLGDVSVTFGDVLQKQGGELEEGDSDIPTEELTPEQLMFLSVGGQLP